MNSQLCWFFALGIVLGATSCSKSDKTAAAPEAGTDAGPKAGTDAGTAADSDTAPPADAGAAVIPVNLISPISLDQVTHKLFQPGDAEVPHPFYQAQCAKQPPPEKYPSASGNGAYTYDPATKTLEFKITYSGLSGPPIMAHFHKGAIGTGGPIVQTICGHPPPGSKALGFSAPAVGPAMCPGTSSGTLTGSYTLGGNDELDPPLSAADEVQLLLGGVLYVNIHTCLNEAGEIRGQVVPMKAP